MKQNKNILLMMIAATIMSCGGSSEPSAHQQSIAERAPEVETHKIGRSELINFSKSDIVRYAISSIMGQPTKGVKVRSADDLYFASYVRKSDAKKFEYKIKIDGNAIVWANADGRWRDGEYDERISFEETGNRLKIYQTFSDGSKETKEYSIGD